MARSARIIAPTLAGWLVGTAKTPCQESVLGGTGQPWVISSQLGLHDGLEAAEDHALRVERHFAALHHLAKARILHDLAVHAVAVRACLERDPREHDDLAFLELHALRKR